MFKNAYSKIKDLLPYITFYIKPKFLFNGPYKLAWEAFTKTNNAEFYYALPAFINPLLVNPTIFFVYKNCEIKIYIIQRQAGPSRIFYKYTRLEVNLPERTTDHFTLCVPTSICKSFKNSLPSKFKTGDEYFDKHYLIEGNNNKFLQDLFSDHCLKELIINQPSPFIKLTDNNLYFETPEIIYNTDELQNLYNLTKYLIDKLYHNKDSVSIIKSTEAK